jgi:hypothetical protein
MHGAKSRPRLLDGPRHGDALRKAAGSAWKVTLSQRGVAALVEHQKDEPVSTGLTQTCERLVEHGDSRFEVSTPDQDVCEVSLRPRGQHGVPSCL